MLIAISTYLKPLPVLDADYREPHVAYIKRLIDDKKVLMAGRQTDNSGGVIISQTNLSRQAFEQLLENDPYVVAQAAEYHIIEFEPGLKSVTLADILSLESAMKPSG